MVKVTLDLTDRELAALRDVLEHAGQEIHDAYGSWGPFGLDDALTLEEADEALMGVSSKLGGVEVEETPLDMDRVAELVRAAGHGVTILTQEGGQAGGLGTMYCSRKADGPWAVPRFADVDLYDVVAGLVYADIDTGKVTANRQELWVSHDDGTLIAPADAWQPGPESTERDVADAILRLLADA